MIIVKLYIISYGNLIKVGDCHSSAGGETCFTTPDLVPKQALQLPSWCVTTDLFLPPQSTMNKAGVLNQHPFLPTGHTVPLELGKRCRDCPV